MKRLLLAAAGSLMTFSAVQAADIVEPAAYDWTGPYVGLQAGYAWGDNDVQGKGPVSEGMGGEALAAIVADPPKDGSIDMDGFVGGLHAGYNWQSDSLVLGVEGDIEYADLSGSEDIFLDSDDDEPIGKARQSIDWLGSLRLRAGFAADRALFYATGGLAVGGVDMRAKDADFGTNDGSETAWGWTIGGGVEYAFTDELSARLEYRYTDLGDTDVRSATPEIGDKVEFENSFHAVRAGLTWHFGSL